MTASDAPSAPARMVRAVHFSHYAVQWAPVREGVIGTYQHVDLADVGGLSGARGFLAIFRSVEAAETCMASTAPFMPPGVTMRVVRYHTSGYSDVAEAPDEPRASGYFDDPPPVAPTAPEPKSPRRKQPQPVEMIDE